MGFDVEANRTHANMLLEKMKLIPGLVDARIKQSFNYPQLNVIVDRTLSKELGYTQLDVGNNMLISFPEVFKHPLTFWLDRKNGVSYPIVTQTPQYDMNSLQTLRNIPITSLLSTSQVTNTRCT